MNLANPAHLDPQDDSRSYAIWVVSNPQLPPPKIWFFLLPDVGIAVELADGTGISWDGRCVRHCTAVQECDSRDALMSLFFCVPKHVLKQQAQANEMKHAIRVRHKMKAVCPAYKKGDVVWVRWSPSRRKNMRKCNVNERWSRRLADVGEVTNDGLWLLWGRKTPRGRHTYQAEVPKDIIHNLIVRAGAINERMYETQLPNMEMVGKKIQVYVFERDAVLEGICVELQLDGKKPYLVLSCKENTIVVPIEGLLNPPCCVVDE